MFLFPIYFFCIKNSSLNIHLPSKQNKTRVLIINIKSEKIIYDPKNCKHISQVGKVQQIRCCFRWFACITSLGQIIAQPTVVNDGSIFKGRYSLSVIFSRGSTLPCCYQLIGSRSIVAHKGSAFNAKSINLFYNCVRTKSVRE